MIKSIACITVATLLLAACSTTPAWKTAKAVPPLAIPAGIDTPGTSNELVVPHVADADNQGELLSNTRPPATSQDIVLAAAPATAWSRVGAVLEESGVGKIVARDAATHSYRLELSAADLDPGHRSLKERLLHRAPDIQGIHEATVSVADDGKGRSTVMIDGDSMAVSKLHKVLNAASAPTETKAEDADQ